MVTTFGSLFAGIGGFDLGLERAGLECRWQVEIDPFCQAVLETHWPGVARYGDIKQVDFGEVEPVDVICGGFPCQDISRVGRMAGIDGGVHSGLWAEMYRAIRVLRPCYALVENSTSLLVRGIDRVLGDLAEIGFDAEWECLPAAAFGAPHIRDRLYLLAYPRGGRYGTSEETVFAGWTRAQLHGGWAPESGVARVADGIPCAVDQRRAYGNAVVPAVAEWIASRIVAL